MKKEIIISVIILLLVVTLDVITQRYTNKAMNEISQELTNIRKDLSYERQDELKNYMEKTMDKWKRYKEKLVIYIEHDELEKVEMYILETKSHIETKEYSMAEQSIDTAVFIIEHIKEKYEFNWEGIF